MQCFLKDLAYFVGIPRHSSYQLEIGNHQIHGNSLYVHAPFVFLLLDSIAFKASNMHTCAGLYIFTHLHILVLEIHCLKY